MIHFTSFYHEVLNQGPLKKRKLRLCVQASLTSGIELPASLTELAKVAFKKKVNVPTAKLDSLSLVSKVLDVLARSAITAKLFFGSSNCNFQSWCCSLVVMDATYVKAHKA